MESTQQYLDNIAKRKPTPIMPKVSHDFSIVGSDLGGRQSAISRDTLMDLSFSTSIKK